MTRSADSMPTPGEANAVRLLVVEDHPLFRDALVGVVATAFPNAEVFQAISIDGALDILASKGSVDIILLDLSMPGTTRDSWEHSASVLQRRKARLSLSRRTTAPGS